MRVADTMKAIVIRDSTLREGMELPGVELSLKEKLKIAGMLNDMHVPEIEIGMPYGIKNCLPLARAIKDRGMKIRTSALIVSYRPNWKEEVAIAADSAIDRVDILFPSSDILLKVKDYYKVSKEELPGFVADTVGYAKRHLKRVGLGFVDATRTKPDFLVKLIRKAQDARAERVIVYDTVGIATPALIKDLVTRIKRKCSIPILVHCHNDFGLATANTLAGIEAGADAVDVVANGLGDRGGNAPLEEVVLALELLYGSKTGIRIEKLTELSRLVEETSGIRKCLVKPVVGAFTFLHSPVQHIRNAASGNRKGFEPFEPDVIGAERRYAFTLPVDYSDALEPFLKKTGLQPDSKGKSALLRSLRLASRNGGLSEKQVIALIRKSMRTKIKR